MLYAWQWLKLHKMKLTIYWFHRDMAHHPITLSLPTTHQTIHKLYWKMVAFHKKNMPCLSQTNIDIRQLLHLFFFCWRFFFDIKFSIFLYASECSHAQMVRGDHIKNMAKNVEFYVEQRTRPNRMLISRLNVKLFHIYIVKGELLGVAKTK